MRAVATPGIVRRAGGVSWALALLWLVSPVAAANRPALRLASGSWGGEHVALQVEERLIRIELDCAHGAIDGEVVLDARGRFDVMGTYTPEGGPTTAGDEQRLPARYSGSLAAGVMKLVVALGEGRGAPIELTLGRGKAARLRKCD
jgi:hypothetical protein